MSWIAVTLVASMWMIGFLSVRALVFTLQSIAAALCRIDDTLRKWKDDEKRRNNPDWRV